MSRVFAAARGEGVSNLCSRCNAYVASHCATDEQQSRCEFPPYFKQAERAAKDARIAELEAALRRALNFIENNESQFGETFQCGDIARAALSEATS